MRNEVDQKVLNKVKSLLEKDPDEVFSSWNVSMHYYINKEHHRGYIIELAYEYTSQINNDTVIPCCPNHHDDIWNNIDKDKRENKLVIILTTPSNAKYTVKASPEELDNLIQQVQIKIKHYLELELED